ncbi:MAG: addiction module protein [Candidatus Auribacterota bacterium]|nr:addiction module protein [Candidatus Auribacterota bacterium]
MSPNLKECKDQALNLHVKERAVLAEYLIASLDSLDDTENEQLWLKEAERRYQEYRKGNISARLAEDVLRDARSAIR